MIYAVVVIIEILDLYKSFLYRFLLSQKKSNVSFWSVDKESRALSHPVRQKILKLLATLECCCNGELRELIPMAQSAISQHLKSLLKACLILGLINPTSVAEAVVSSMCDCFATTFRYGLQSEK